MQGVLNTIYIKLREHRGIFEKFIFPVMLVLYPFTNINRGIDVTDTAYSLGNFLYPDGIEEMWMLSTYLHQLTGQFFMHLPMGDTLIGMKLWCTLFICVSVLAAYYLLQTFLPAWMIFIGEWIAISLCLCPVVILYNYMSYTFFTLGMIFLVRGLTANYIGRKWLFFAGVCLGLNVFVRLPNILETVAVFLVILYGVMTGKDAPQIFKEIFTCIGGFFAGFLVPFIAVCVTYDTHAYFDMIAALFNMSETATEYSAGGMLSLIFSAYGSTLSKMLIMLPCIAAGVILFSVMPEKLVALKRAIYIAGLVVLILYYFSSGTFTLNYWYYDSIFNAAMMFIILSIIFFIIDIAGFLHGSYPERLLSMTAFLMILILPLGSNNYTYPLLNALFFVAPASLGVFRRIFRAACGKRKGEYRSKHHSQHFSWVSMSVAVVAVLIVQGTVFHSVYSFRDGDGGAALESESVIPKLKYMKTTKANASQLDALYTFLNDSGLSGKKAVLFGDIPGLSYIMDLEPAVFSTWPDLDSVMTEDFDRALSALAEESEKPLIIMHGDGTNYEYSERKYNLLLLYMEENGYTKGYDDGVYRVYSAG